MMTKELPKQTYILAKSGITKDQMVTLVLYEPNEKQDHIRSWSDEAPKKKRIAWQSKHWENGPEAAATEVENHKSMDIARIELL